MGELDLAGAVGGADRAGRPWSGLRLGGCSARARARPGEVPASFGRTASCARANPVAGRWASSIAGRSGAPSARRERPLETVRLRAWREWLSSSGAASSAGPERSAGAQASDAALIVGLLQNSAAAVRSRPARTGAEAGPAMHACPNDERETSRASGAHGARSDALFREEARQRLPASGLGVRRRGSCARCGRRRRSGWPPGRGSAPRPTAPGRPG